MNALESKDYDLAEKLIKQAYAMIQRYGKAGEGKVEKAEEQKQKSKLRYVVVIVLILFVLFVFWMRGKEEKVEGRAGVFERDVSEAKQEELEEQ